MAVRTRKNRMMACRRRLMQPARPARRRERADTIEPSPDYRDAMETPRLAEGGPPADVDFDAVIDAVLDDLPDAFLGRLGSVAIVVEDEASPDQLASVGAPRLL